MPLMGPTFPRERCFTLAPCRPISQTGTREVKPFAQSPRLRQGRTLTQSSRCLPVLSTFTAPPPCLLPSLGPVWCSCWSQALARGWSSGLPVTGFSHLRLCPVRTDLCFFLAFPSSSRTLAMDPPRSLACLVLLLSVVRATGPGGTSPDPGLEICILWGWKTCLLSCV